MPAAEAARSAASTVRSRAPAFALIPQCSAAEVKPCGAVTPPAAGVNVTAPAGVASPERTARRRDASAMERRQRYAGLPVAGERQHHRVLAAPAELRAGPAIGVDFLGQPDMRNDGETELHEIGRYVGERTELVETGCRRATDQLVDQLTPCADRPRFLGDNQGTHLRNRAAQLRKISARHNAVAISGDDETMRVDDDLAEIPWQETALVDVIVDQRVDRLRIRGGGRADHQRCDGARVRQDDRADLQGVLHRRRGGAARAGHTGTSEATEARTASSMSTARSMSAASMVSGGSRRTTFSLVLLTSRPFWRAWSTTGPASMRSSMPRMRPAPRASTMTGCFSASARSRRSKCAPTVLTCSRSPPSVSCSRKNAAARVASRLPP